MADNRNVHVSVPIGNAYTYQGSRSNPRRSRYSTQQWKDYYPKEHADAIAGQPYSSAQDIYLRILEITVLHAKVNGLLLEGTYCMLLQANHTPRARISIYLSIYLRVPLHQFVEVFGGSITSICRD
jgi:hypothetical protein